MRRDSPAAFCEDHPTGRGLRASGPAVRPSLKFHRPGAGAFTLFELILVMTVMVILCSFVIVNVAGYTASQRLTLSAKNLRSLIYMTRAVAMHDGAIHRVRFDDELREQEDLGTPQWYQPIVEKQVDPVEAPQEFERVNESWARDPVLRDGVRCYAIVFGEPSFEGTLGEDLEVDDNEEREPEDLAPLVLTPDGTGEWFTLWLTTAPEDEEPTADGYQQLSLVMDGRTGQIWIQQPLDEEEIELLKSYNLAPLIRADRIDQPRLEEGNILRLDRRPFANRGSNNATQNP